MSKLVQAIRYLDLPYPFELKDILEASNGELLNFNMPNQLYRQIKTKPIHAIFGENSIDGSFLSNSWGTSIVLASLLGVWALCKVVSYLLERVNKLKGTLVCAILKVLSRTILNFLIIQLYGNLGDIVFFSVLEMKSVTFLTPLSNLSFIICLIFIIFAILVIILHLRFVFKYKFIRRQRSDLSARILENFIEKHDYLKLLHLDFADSAIHKQAFALILVSIDMLVGLIVAVMVPHPLAESILLVISSVLLCIYLVWRHPFRERFEQVTQIFLEICVVIVYICVLIFAVICQKHKHSKRFKKEKGSLALGIIIVIIIIKISSCLFMCVKIIQQAIGGYKTLTNRRRSKIKAVMNIITLNKHRDRPLYIEPMSSDRASSRVNIAEILSSYGQNSPINLNSPNSARLDLLEVSSDKLDGGSGGLARRFNIIRSKLLNRSKEHSEDSPSSIVMKPDQDSQSVKKACVIPRHKEVSFNKSFQNFDQKNLEPTQRVIFLEFLKIRQQKITN